MAVSRLANGRHIAVVSGTDSALFTAVRPVYYDTLAMQSKGGRSRKLYVPSLPLLLLLLRQVYDILPLNATPAQLWRFSAILAPDINAMTYLLYLTPPLLRLVKCEKNLLLGLSVFLTLTLTLTLTQH